MTTAEAIDPAPQVVDLEERNWLPRHCRGDVSAFAELMGAYRTLVFTFLQRYGVRADERDDLFQEIFLKIHLAADSYQPSQPLRPWIVTIVLNTVRNARRKQGRAFWLAARAGEMKPGTAPATDRVVNDRATVEWLEGRIGQLPAVQREVLVLSTLKGLRMQDVAAVMQLPENTIKTHLRRARVNLAGQLAARVSGENSQ